VRAIHNKHIKICKREIWVKIGYKTLWLVMSIDVGCMDEIHTKCTDTSCGWGTISMAGRARLDPVRYISNRRIL